MLSPDSHRFLVPVAVWLGGAVLSIGLFVVWATNPKALNQNLAVTVGALACLISLGALTEVLRRAISPRLLIATIAIYTVGAVASAAVSFLYALFFSVFHAKDF